MDNRHTLILFTDAFPFAQQETYVKTELGYLSRYFSFVHILCSHHNNEPVYDLPENVSANQVNLSLSRIEKIKSLFRIFSSQFWKELFYALCILKVHEKINVVKIILLYLETARKCERHLDSLIKRNNLQKVPVVYYSFWTDARALAIAQFRQQVPGIAISRAHGWDVYFERHHPAYLPFRKFLSDQLDAVFFVSRNGREYLLKKIKGSSEQKFRYRCLGTIFRGNNPKRTEQTNVIVSSSSIIWLKRIHLIVDTLRHIDNVPVHWIHFGGGPMENEITQYAQTHLNSKSNITYEFKGYVENEELLQFYGTRHVDLFMLTSEYEGMPYAIMEALSFGIPVAATNVGGVSEMVNAENGFLLEKNFAPKNTAKILSDYLQGAESVITLKRSAAYAFWKENFDAEKVYPAFIEEVLTLNQ